MSCGKRMSLTPETQLCGLDKGSPLPEPYMPTITKKWYASLDACLMQDIHLPELSFLSYHALCGNDACPCTSFCCKDSF